MKIKSKNLKINCCTKWYKIEEETCSSLESPNPPLRAHRIGEKKMGESRQVIVCFLRFPERELVFRITRELESDTDVKVYSDLPQEVSERRKKQWPKLKKAREERKIAIFNKPEPDKLFTDGKHCFFDVVVVFL